MRLLVCAPALIGIALAVSSSRRTQHHIEIPQRKRDGVYKDRQPLVLDGKIPQYPQLALAAGIDGTVLMNVTVAHGVVSNVEFESKAHGILVESAKEIVMSWRFPSEISEVIPVKYVFAISDEEVLVSPINPKIVLELPSYVKVVANRVKSLPVRNN